MQLSNKKLNELKNQKLKTFFIEMCLEYKYLYLILEFMGECNLLFLLAIYNILYLKKIDDALQGINKLDYLLKVSVFQYYKDPKL